MECGGGVYPLSRLGSPGAVVEQLCIQYMAKEMRDDIHPLMALHPYTDCSFFEFIQRCYRGQRGPEGNLHFVNLMIKTRHTGLVGLNSNASLKKAGIGSVDMGHHGVRCPDALMDADIAHSLYCSVRLMADQLLTIHQNYLCQNPRTHS